MRAGSILTRARSRQAAEETDAFYGGAIDFSPEVAIALDR
tara:strand:- start:749 stop:868 length:120 start_codon:yes stop_codon:yes gene_type:complete